MSNISTYSHYSRRFLNNEGHNGLAAVLAEVRPGDVEESYLDFGASFSLSDCHRTITLDFGVYGSTTKEKDLAELREDLKNARDKANRLKAELDTFYSALTASLDQVEAEIDKREHQMKNETKG